TEQQLSDIQQQIPLDVSSLSRAVTKLRKDGFIIRGKVKNKARGMSFALAAAGEKIVKDIDNKGAKLIELGLAEHDKHIAIQLRDLLNKVVSDKNSSNTSVIQEKVEVKKLDALTDRQIAR